MQTPRAASRAPGSLPRLDETLAEESPSFRDRMEFILEISTLAAPTPIVINGQNIVRFSVDLHRSGFAGELSFKISDDTPFGGTERDPLLVLFRSPSLLRIRFGIRPQHAQQNLGTLTTLPVLEMNGLCTEKSMVERVARHLSGNQISHRQYTLRFADPAQVLWRQHYPLALYTQKSLKDVITANINQYIQVDFTDTTLSEIQPQIFLGLQANRHPDERASFYDLLMWKLEDTERMWIYDYARKRYAILKTKPLPVAINVVGDDIDEIFTYYPPPPRAAESLLNDSTESWQRRPLTPTDPLVREHLVRDLRSDVRFNTPIQTEFDQALTRRNAAFKLPKPEIVLRYRSFPSLPFAPGAGIDLNLPLTQAELLGTAIAVPEEARAELGRVFRIAIAGTAVEDNVAPAYDGQAPATFACRINVWVEAASNLARRPPPHVIPKYPVYLEGKIYGEVGLPLDETYQFYPDPSNYINKYKITVPLFDRQIITAPYTPGSIPGHFYFPAYKNERVLLALHYDRAEIKDFLDWRTTAQLPLETQGDQLLMGKGPYNRTSLRHTYQSEVPVFEIETMDLLRSTDVEVLRMTNGSVSLEVGPPPGLPPGLPLAAGLPTVPITPIAPALPPLSAPPFRGK